MMNMRVFFVTLHDFSEKMTLDCPLTLGVIQAMAHCARSESERERKGSYNVQDRAAFRRQKGKDGQ